MSTNPFPGPQPYRAADRNRFYGRDVLIKKLANQILARSATTVFGPSGAGKSSLLQAGVIPALEDSDDIRLVRVDAWPAGETPLPWLVNTIATDLELGSQVQTQASVEALQETIDLAGRQSDRPMVVYLDQFEQVFLADHTEQALKDLLDGLTWLIRRKQNRELHLVLSLREDYLGRLRDWTRDKPELTAHGFRVGPLTVGEMVKAMCRTAAGGDPPQTWNPDDIRSLMLDVRVAGQSASESAEIQAAFAQIVCRAVWDELAAGKNVNMRTANAESILHRYLDTTLAGLGPLQESALMLLEKHLIDEEGHRTLLTEREANTVLPAKDAKEVLEALEKAAVLHAEEHQGSRYFELGHDWLAKKVFERRIERKEREAAEAKAAVEREARWRFRRNLAYTAIAWVILGSLTAWAFWERSVAKTALGEAEKSERKAKDQSESARKAELRAVRSSRMATARDLIFTGQPDLAAMVLTSVDDPTQVSGWTQAALDALKVRLPYSTLRIDPQSRFSQWSHDGTRVLVFTADGGLTITYADRKAKPIYVAVQAGPYANAMWSPDDAAIFVEGVKSAAAVVVRSDGTGKPVALGSSEYRVIHAAWSLDSKRLAASFADKTVSVWDVGQWTEPVVHHYENIVEFIAWSPDGTKISTSLDNKAVLVQSTTDRAVIFGGITDLSLPMVVWSPDGKHIAAATTDVFALPAERSSLVTIALSDKPQIERQISVGKGTVRDLQWAPKGQRLAVATGNFARVVDMMGGGETIDLKGHLDEVIHVAWSPNGEQIATASADKTVRIWNASGLGPGLVLAGHTDSSIGFLMWKDGGKRISTASADGTARTWNVIGPGQPVVLEPQDGILAGAWHPDGARVLLNTAHGEPQIWTTNGERGDAKLRNGKALTTDACWSLDGQMIASIVFRQPGLPKPLRLGNNRPILTGDPAGGRVLVEDKLRECTIEIQSGDGSDKPKALYQTSANLSHLTVSPDGKHLATLVDGTTLLILDVSGSHEPVTIKLPQRAETSPLWSPDGKTIALIMPDQHVALWESNGSGKAIHLSGNVAEIRMGAWSPDGKRFAVAGGDSSARIWALDMPDKPIEFVGHQGPILHLAWSPDGMRIATVSADATLRIWNAKGDDKPLLLQGHQSGEILMVQWSPDGKRLVTASEDQTARIWNADGRGTVLVLAGHERAVKQAFWSPNGKRILTISQDKTARVWLVELADLQKALRAITTDCLSPEQREMYLIENKETARGEYAKCEKEQGRTP